jgi:type VI secretion system protein ImpL
MNILKSRLFLAGLGVLCLSLLVWFGGPWIGFQSVVARLLAILLLVAIWAIVLQVRQIRHANATHSLTSGGAAKAEARSGKEAHAESADAAALRASFAAAASFLRASGSGRTSIYEVPWYAIIGPPGCGKSTLIDKSGLRFPVSQRAQVRKVIGVGGTRNCDWWFTDEAVLIDTAGRFTTQDSNSAADRDGWLEFLSLLKKYRRRRPLNGLFVAYSARDLATKSDLALSDDALLIRQRLEEIQRTLQISLPVYFLLTQCDLIAGFAEYFHDLDSDGRKQVWGFTFDVSESELGTATSQVQAHFHEITERLASRLITRLQSERQVQQCVKILGFPSQFAALSRRLSIFLDEVFSSGRFDRVLFLRGVYFSSGTQTGSSVDRMMAAVAREFGIESPSYAAPALSARAFFIERLLRGVVFPESGLAGTHRSLEVRKALLQLSAYLGCVAVGALAVLWLSVSYARNSSYLSAVKTSLAQLQQLNRGPTGGADVEQILRPLDRLKALVETANRHGEAKPWSMRFGLYQPSSVGEAAQDAYVRVVDSAIVPLLAEQLRARLTRVANEPEQLFETLEAYLLLGDKSRIGREKHAVAEQAAAEWQARYAADPSVPLRLSAHLQSLLQSGQALDPGTLDAGSVTRARASLAGLTPKRLVYARIARAYSSNPELGVRLSDSAGMNNDKVLTRRSGRPLSDPLPYLYTRPAFEEISGVGVAKAVATFVRDNWVFGSSGGLTEESRLPFDILSVYEDDYIAKWDAFIGDVGIKPASGAAGVREVLDILSAPDSPLRSLVKTTIDNTSLVKPVAKQNNSPLAQLGQAGTGLAANAMSLAQSHLGAGSDPPGTRITQHFQRLAAAGPAVEQCLNSLAQISQQLKASQNAMGNGAAAAVGQGGALDLAQGLQSCAQNLPPPINNMMREVSAASQAAAVAQVNSQLADQLAQKPNGECKEIVLAHYPFSYASVNEAPLVDFGRVFGVGGSLDAFFRDNLARYVDTSSTPWRWREVGDTHISMPPQVLPAFQQASRIRDAFFQSGGLQPQLRFTLTAESLDPDVVRFALEVDGQKFEYRHDPPQPWTALWPGPSPGMATLRFQDRNGGGPTLSRQGPWAWFRILDNAQFERMSDTRYLVTFRVEGKTARVFLDSGSIRNPYERHVLDRFKCPE